MLTASPPPRLGRHDDAMSDEGAGEQTPAPAGVGRRVAARAVDGVLWAVPTTIALNLAFGGRPADHSEAPDWFRPVTLTISVAAFLYEVLLTWRLGQTVGKRLLKVRVRRLETTAPPDLWSSTLRAVVVTALPLVLVSERLSSETGMALDVGAGLILLAFLVLRPDTRGLHDLAAGTRVVPARAATGS